MRAVMAISALGGLRSHPGLKTGLRTRLTIHQRHRKNRGRLVTDSMEKGGIIPAFFVARQPDSRPIKRKGLAKEIPPHGHNKQQRQQA